MLLSDSKVVRSWAPLDVRQYLIANYGDMDLSEKEIHKIEDRINRIVDECSIAQDRSYYACKYLETVYAVRAASKLLLIRR